MSLEGVRLILRHGVIILAAAFMLAGVAGAEEQVPPTLDSLDPLTGLAELPHWPIGFIPPCITATPDRKGKFSAALLAWMPPKARRIRSLFIIPNNTDSKHIGEHGPIKEMAAKHEMGIVYLRGGDWPQIQPILDALSERTGIKEIRHAPWIVQGKSSRGMFPIRMAWTHPKRTIAGITYHGETPTWPPAADAKLDGESVLWVNANGESEWGGTWFVHVRPSLLNYRARKNWLPHVLVVKGVGHGNYPDAAGSQGSGKKFPDRVTCIDVWDYFAVYIDKALELRVPKDEYPTDGPVELMQVDDSKGYLIGQFAVEDLWRKPHYKLESSDTGEYLVGAKADKPVSGFVVVPPAKGYGPAEGVPVVPAEMGKSSSKWLVTQSVPFAMKRDPMTDLGGWEKLRPVPGDTLEIDSAETTFSLLPANKVAKKRGGVSLQGVKQWGRAMTFAAYTVLDVPAKTRMKLVAPFSVAGRLQIALNGMPVAHKQVVAVEKGLYPMLAVLRLDGPNWGSIDPHFVEVTDELVAQAKEAQAEADRLAAEQARILAEGIKNAVPPIRPYADVPEAERKRMFWVADREQAEAWFKVHAIHGQKFSVQ